MIKRGVVAGGLLFVKFEISEKGVVGANFEVVEESLDLDFVFDGVLGARFGDRGILTFSVFGGDLCVRVDVEDVNK